MKALHPKSPPIARLCWTAAFVALLALGALLVTARTSSAAPPSATAPASPAFDEGQEELEEELEEWEEDEEEEELGVEEEPNWEAEGWEEEELGGTDCELGHEALAEGLLTLIDVEDLCAAEKEWEGELEGRPPHGRGARSPCALRSARARVVTRRNRLTLTIGYAVAAPTKARIEVRAGKRKLASVKRRLGRNGVIRLNRRVGKRLGRQLGKRSGGKRVKLRIKLPRRAAACPSRRLVLFAK
jgi:hypothetical protein